MVKIRRIGNSDGNLAVFNDIEFTRIVRERTMTQLRIMLFAILTFSVYVYAGRVQFYLLPVKVR